MREVKTPVPKGAGAGRASKLAGPDAATSQGPARESTGICTTADFSAALADFGAIIRHPPEPDGVLRRYAVRGDKPGTRNAWAVLFADPLAGAMGNWRTGERRNWSAGGAAPLTPVQKRALADKVKRAQADAQAVRWAAWRAVAEGARERWGRAPACFGHPYLTAKGVEPHGLRAEGECLLVPLRDADGVLWSLQTIDAQGQKRFATGGRVKGLFHAIGAPCGRIVVCEGVATGASLYAALKDSVGPHLVACAMTAGNLEPVAVALARKYPGPVLTIAADNDTQTPGNPGVTAARAAAQAVGARVLIPPGPGDWNDWINGAHAPHNTKETAL